MLPSSDTLLCSWPSIAICSSSLHACRLATELVERVYADGGRLGAARRPIPRAACLRETPADRPSGVDGTLRSAAAASSRYVACAIYVNHQCVLGPALCL